MSKKTVSLLLSRDYEKGEYYPGGYWQPAEVLSPAHNLSFIIPPDVLDVSEKIIETDHNLYFDEKGNLILDVTLYTEFPDKDDRY